MAQISLQNYLAVTLGPKLERIEVGGFDVMSVQYRYRLLEELISKLRPPKFLFLFA